MNYKKILLLSAIILIGLFTLSQTNRGGQVTYEYTIYRENLTGYPSLSQALNNLGSEGWQLVGIRQGVASQGTNWRYLEPPVYILMRTKGQ